MRIRFFKRSTYFVNLRLIIGNKVEDIENVLLPNGPQVPPERTQEFGILRVFRTTYKEGMLQGTPSKSCFESGGTEPNQCRHAIMSTILISPLAYSWPALPFQERQYYTALCARAWPISLSI